MSPFFGCCSLIYCRCFCRRRRTVHFPVASNQRRNVSRSTTSPAGARCSAISVGPKSAWRSSSYLPQHLRPQRRQLAPWTGLAPQPRHQSRVALGLITSPDPLGLPGAQAQHLRGLHRGQFLAVSRHHNRQPIPFFPTHFQCLHVVAGVTTATPPKRGHSHRVPTRFEIQHCLSRRGQATCLTLMSGRSVAWLARLFRVQEVVSSNLTAPTIFKLPVFDFRSLIWNFRETNRLLKSDGVFFVKKPFDRNWNSL